jgi:hypothetical protein
MKLFRWILPTLLLALGLDILVIIVTGTTSLVLPFGVVGAVGVIGRAALTAALLVLWQRRLLDTHLRWATGTLVLTLLLLPTLVHFHLNGARVNGDGIMYYVYVRSVFKDFDFDLTNEYTHYGLITRGDLARPTRTGMRRSVFSTGPVVVWAPFFLLGEGVARVQAALGGNADLSGYGPAHRNAVALGGLLCGFLGVLLVHAWLRRHFSAGAALGAALLLWGASFLYWYMVYQPTYAHPPSFLAVALFLWLFDRDRGQRGAWGHFLLGLALGVAMCNRWQNGIFMLLPALELLSRLRASWRDWPRLIAAGAACGVGLLIGILPQMVAWHVLYAIWILTYPPHGVDFVRLDHPFLMNTLFSSRHGLLSWTPVLWGGYLGYLSLLRRRFAWSWPLVALLAVMTWVNACSGDWWAGGSFSSRRFDGVLPLLAAGLAATLTVAERVIARHPRGAVAAALVPFAIWTALLERQRASGSTRSTSFATLVGENARIFSASLGSPPTWPASWIFAWRHGRSPAQYDLLVGRYLFYRQNNLGGLIDLGTADDDALLGEGWSERAGAAGVSYRRMQGSARLFAPLDQAETLELRVRARGMSTQEVAVDVNDRAAGSFLAGPEWAEGVLVVEQGYWRRELNEVRFTTHGTELQVDSVLFRQVR